MVRAVVRHLDSATVQPHQRSLPAVPGGSMARANAPGPARAGRLDPRDRSGLRRRRGPLHGRPVVDADRDDRVARRPAALGPRQGSVPQGAADVLRRRPGLGLDPPQLQPGALATPRSVRAVIGPDPQVIADASWAKVVWAGLNLTDEDLSKDGDGIGSPWR